MDREFFAKFAGADEEEAYGKAAKALEGQYEFDANGRKLWTSNWAETAGGHQRRIFVTPDKNRAQERLEAITAKIAKFVRERAEEGRDVFGRKEEGIITIDFIPIALVIVHSFRETTIKVNEEIETIVPGVRRNELLDHVNQGAAAAAMAKVQWV